MGESDQRFVVLKRSNGHYTLLCTQVSLSTKKDSNDLHLKDNGVFGIEQLREAFHVDLWGFDLDVEEEEDKEKEEEEEQGES